MSLIVLLLLTCLAVAQQAFQSLEGVVGYVVVERGGKVENYLVVEQKEGSVRLIKVDKDPSKALKKAEDREGGKK
ncbi:MAG: hypothetical protein N2648_01145 [Aquificaceae bacterium]|nr:hypothetical protein [Aquificaceae bacterium]MCX7989233.1 hypothetical protein [Aquificaceae bacterium]MDW8295185.1 hypothetical protein [Aquificaceae bacterium]